MKKILWAVMLLCLYLVSTVPVGLFLYSLKGEKNINIFSKTGFHAYMSCLKNEAEKAIQPQSNDSIEE